MNLLDKIAYDSGGYTVQEILSSFCIKIIEIIDLVNKNEEVCDESRTIIENIRNEVVPELVEDIMKELQDKGYFDSLVNVTLIEQLRSELTTLLNDTITDFTTKLDNIENKVYDYGFIPQCPLPCKYGDNENSYKLVIKNNSNEYLVIQKTNKGYLKHTLKRGIGDSSYSVGQNWELLRLFNVEKCLETFVWLEPNAISGSLLKTVAPSDFNGVESNLLQKATSNNICNKQGITLFELQASQQAEFYIPKVYNNKFSIKYLANDNRSEKVEFYVNNVLVKTINTRNNDTTGCYQDLEFNVPFTKNTTSGKWTLKIINKDDTNKFSFIGFNFKSLGEYKGEYIDSYKIYPLDSYFINTIGANDYAIKDKDLNKWCGSYHGGELLLWNKIKWNTTSDYGRLEYEKESEFDLILDNTFTLIKDFTIYQQTDINSKAKMLSIFDFNANGTVNMTFSLYDNVINASDIYTQMVCTDTNFKSLIYPELKPVNINGETSFKNVIGKVIQKNALTNDKLTIRHDVFTNTYNTKGSFIVHDDSNSKCYYGVVSNYTEGINIPHLNFNKAIDFEINTL